MPTGSCTVRLVEHRPLMHTEAVEVRRALGTAPEHVAHPPQAVELARLAAVQLARVVVPAVRVRLPAPTLPEQRLSGRGAPHQHARPRRPPQQDSLLDEVVLEDEVEDRVALRARRRRGVSASLGVERVTWREAHSLHGRTGSCVSWPFALMEPRTRPRIRSRKATAAGRHTEGSMDDAKRMAQGGIVEAVSPAAQTSRQRGAR